ncbi:hypothetical protein CRUP_000223 [Coryphaenoides rupestris]|nr:hypothetical protein CRUP_000223 [Coryphaenoides rupestris]
MDNVSHPLYYALAIMDNGGLRGVALPDRLAEIQVPLLIFSAGVGDILEEVVHQSQVFHPNVHGISNYMDFDAHLQLIGVIRTVLVPVLVLEHVRRHGDHPPLPDTHARQTLVQAVDHLVCSQLGLLPLKGGMRMLRISPTHMPSRPSSRPLISQPSPTRESWVCSRA